MRMTSGMFSSTRDDYETPDSTYDPLHSIFHFNLDVCASAKNAKVADNFIPEEWDSLSVPWANYMPADDYVPGSVSLMLQGRLRCWMNPPYGDQVMPFTDKAVQEADNGILTVGLLAARTDNEWFHTNVAKADFALFLRGRIKFLLPCTMCGISTVDRRRPSIWMLGYLEEEGVISHATHGDMWDKGTLPICNACASKDLANWGKRSVNSPAVGSMVVGWGVGDHVLAATSVRLRQLGVLVRP